MGDTVGLPSIIYEDRSLLAVRKPPRMHTAPGPGGGDLCAWVFERYPDVEKAGGRADGSSAAGRRASREGGLLHRLDYETSGIVLFARNPGAFDALLRQQELGAFRKDYLSLSAASRASMPAGSRPRRAAPGGLDATAWTEARDRLDSGALAAMLEGARSEAGLGVASSFRAYGPGGSRVACIGAGGIGPSYRSDILACSEAASAQWLEIRVGLSRGFRHQVRAHLAWIGLPIAGDPLYGGAPDERLRLYAVGLSFEHPETGNRLSLTADP
jgi:23S rRNA pseudouridine1911/1915/1917 synthase